MDTEARLQTALGDRYTVERQLGEGGMAVVFLAHDAKHGRPVAIKVLRPELAAALGPERFHREIEIAAQLNHPNVLGLHDSGEADGLLYFVMPYVEGESLRDRLDREGTLSPTDAGRVLREVGSALDYAHGQGLIHRDIKPENVLFQAGHALVCDFGIAKAASEAQDGLTRTGMAIGTIPYMSPEQLTGESAIDHTADTYALGCLLHEMLVGEAPFEAQTPQASLARKLLGDVSDVTEVREDVPPTVHLVIERALAPMPDDRFRTSEALVSALEEALTTRAIEDEARRRRRERTRRGVLIGFGVVAVAAVVTAAGSFLTRPTLERIAVIPDPPAATEPDRAFFTQTVYEDLAWEFARAGVRVTSPNSSARFAGGETSVRQIADSLGVDGVVRVQARRTGDSVEIDVALVEGETEEVLWFDQFAGLERNILSMYGDVTRALTDEIGVTLDAATLDRLASAPVVDPIVFEALAKARFEWQKLTEEGFENARGYYDIALERDPNSAEAWFGRSRIWPLMSQQQLMDPEEARERAAPDVARAMALDPGMQQLQADLALQRTWQDWRFDEAEVAFRNALDENPADATTRAYYSLLLLYLGREDDAAREIQRAAAEDPYNTLLQGLRSQNLLGRDLFEESERVLLAGLARDPQAPFLLSMLRTTYHVLEEWDAALDSWRASFTSQGSYAATGDPEALAALDRGAASGGYAQALRAVADLYVTRLEAGQRQSMWGIGTLYVRAGENELALDYLERAYAARNGNVPYLAIDPIFDPLREEPRFQAMIDGLGLPG